MWLCGFLVSLFCLISEPFYCSCIPAQTCWRSARHFSFNISVDYWTKVTHSSVFYTVVKFTIESFWTVSPELWLSDCPSNPPTVPVARHQPAQSTKLFSSSHVLPHAYYHTYIIRIRILYVLPHTYYGRFYILYPPIIY